MKINYLNFFGKKLGMTHMFDSKGNICPITKIMVYPCYISNLEKSKDDKYFILEFSSKFLSMNSKKCTLSKIGMYAKKNLYPLKKKVVNFISNLDLIFKFFKSKTDFINFFLKNKFSLGIFNYINKIDIISKSIGKGFSGNIKRNNFKRGPMSHGSKNHRLPGSIGAGTTPGRVFKNKRMAGRLGGCNVQIQNIEILKFMGNVLYVKGIIPGKKNSDLRFKFKI